MVDNNCQTLPGRNAQRSFTLSQTTNLGLFKTERIYRRQFLFSWKRGKFLWGVRKYCGKRRNCSSRYKISKSSQLLEILYQDKCSKWLNRFTNNSFDSSKLKEFADDNFYFREKGRKFSEGVENTVGKGEISRHVKNLKMVANTWNTLPGQNAQSGLTTKFGHSKLREFADEDDNFYFREKAQSSPRGLKKGWEM